MSVAAHISSPSIILVELEILLTVITIGGWGGFVSFLMKREENSAMHKDIMGCLAQITTSCFTGFILSVIAIDRNLSFNMVMLAAGLGGVFASPILRLLGDKVKAYIVNNNITPK
ncbi:phage holin family protein [Siccibacter turicensis]|uniref:phage holin family protein n=1 Tax=Siccibacter turicensis TaxID=357233 RepID=UPI0023F396CE|nr:phage holin family protein [Siccibacter turicensis]